MAFVFVRLTSLSVTISEFILVIADGIVSFFHGWVIFIVRTHTARRSLSTPQWAFMLLPCSNCCKQCNNEHWGPYLLNYDFLCLLFLVILPSFQCGFYKTFRVICILEHRQCRLFKLTCPCLDKGKQRTHSVRCLFGVEPRSMKLATEDILCNMGG